MCCSEGLDAKGYANLTVRLSSINTEDRVRLRWGAFLSECKCSRARNKGMVIAAISGSENPDPRC